MESLLRFEGLTKRFPNGRGVGPIDLDLAPGVHGLLGPNGSGKTTLIKTLLGFHAPTRGAGTVLGRDLARDPLGVRRIVGYMAENDVFVPGLNAAQTVRLSAELCGLPPARAHEAAAEALHAVGLGEESYHNPARLSTGQRQKMKLASALVHAPRLLVLDEPTNGLDPPARRTMLALVRELAAERGISVLLSTHILPDVESLCQEAVLLRDGLMVGQERVGPTAVAGERGLTWFSVEVLGDHSAFTAACDARRLAWREAHGELEVKAKDVATILALAHKGGHILTKATPAHRQASDTLLDRMEATA